MTKRTTVMLDEDVYDALVKESLAEYKNSKSISKVLNDVVKKGLTNKNRLKELIYSKKVAHTTAKEFERFREEFSKTV